MTGTIFLLFFNLIILYVYIIFRSNNNIINASEEERGIMPRALNDVFKAVNESPNPKNYEVSAYIGKFPNIIESM